MAVTSNAEPIFIGQILQRNVRVQTGVILTPTVAVGLTGQGQTLLNCQESEHGALITDMWCQPLGPIAGGAFLRLFVSDFDAGTINLLSEVSIAASTTSPFARQDLEPLLPQLLSPTQTGIAGKKRGLYVAPNTILSIGLSIDLASPLVVSIQGGFY